VDRSSILRASTRILIGIRSWTPVPARRLIRAGGSLCVGEVERT
jgi:hypothetical protein